MRPHLSVDSRMLFYSGIGTVLQNLLPLLSSHFEITLLLFSHDVQKNSIPPNQDIISLPDFYSPQNTTTYRYKICNAPIYSVREQIALPRLIPSCDLFWSPHYNIPLLPLRVKKRIVTIHDICHLAFYSSSSLIKKTYARMMLRQALYQSDAVFTVSHFSREEIHRVLQVPKNQIQVAYPGVNASWFAQTIPQHNRLLLQKKYALPSLFFLFVGSDKPHKNLPLLLQTYAQHTINLPLVIIGQLHDPPKHLLYSKKIIPIASVPREDLPFFYQTALALIFPSLYEGFGLPPLEAMAAGCPVIAAHKASIPEVCADAALYLYTQQTEELACAMRTLTHDSMLRHSLIEKGKQRAQCFSWIRTAREYRDSFEKLH